MVPGVRIEVMATRIAGAITTIGVIGIATPEGAWQSTVKRKGNIHKSFNVLLAGW